MDIAGRAMINMLQKFPNMSQHNYTTKWGEPWVFGVPDEKEREFFSECGLEAREFLSFFGREAAERYLTRADGRRLEAFRGTPPRRGAFTTMIGMIWMFLTIRSKWYALAVLRVP
jgi:hypothetical protein